MFPQAHRYCAVSGNASPDVFIASAEREGRVGEFMMRRMVKLNGQWSSWEIAVLTEMVSRGDLPTETADTLDRSLTELHQKIGELSLTASPPRNLQFFAA